MIVDPENPAVLPPVIVNVAIWCPANFPEAQLRFTVQNVDLYHYPPPFKASYSWTKVYSGGDSSGHLTLSGGESDVVGSSTSVTGPLTFTVTDDDLGGTATIEVDVPDCTNPPPPVANPLPPVLIVPMVTCAEDFDADSGTGTISFLALNTPGDDGSARSYDFSVTWVDQQTTEDDGSFDDILDSLVADHKSVALHSGTYTVTVTDQADPTLATSQSVDIPPCEPDVPPAEPAPPLAPPDILSVSTQCADPVLLDGTAGFVVLNANYLFLGGSGELGYELTLSSGSPAVEFVAATYSAPAGVANLGASQLAPATYTATFSFLEFPELTDTVTFTIDDCSVNPQQPASPLDVYGVSAFCLPGDDTETLFFVIGLLHPGFVEWVEWSVMDGSKTLGYDSQENPGSTFNPVAVRHVPAGSYDLVVDTHIDPLLEMTLPIEIGTCAAPDPADPADPADPPTRQIRADPADPIVPPTQRIPLTRSTRSTRSTRRRGRPDRSRRPDDDLTAERRQRHAAAHRALGSPPRDPLNTPADRCDADQSGHTGVAWHDGEVV